MKTKGTDSELEEIFPEMVAFSCAMDKRPISWLGLVKYRPVAPSGDAKVLTGPHRDDFRIEILVRTPF